MAVRSSEPAGIQQPVVELVRSRETLAGERQLLGQTLVIFTDMVLTAFASFMRCKLTVSFRERTERDKGVGDVPGRRLALQHDDAYIVGIYC